MSQEILQSIIDDFYPEKFSRFFRDKNRSFAPQQETMDRYNDESFKDGLKLGEIEFSKTEKLIVSAFRVKKSLSERSGKKAQYEKGKKILKDTQSDAGIFIFYDPQDNFRFSLIYPETFGTRRQWSSFRRFTYFVSREFTNKTYLARIGDGDFSSLEKIKDAFSVEKVTKEFYQEYRKLFENLAAGLSANHTFLNQAAKYNINTENFAKKLLGQIVFIYFVQKKGWMGVPAGGNWGEGDKNFLSNLFKESVAKKGNFFNDYLEKLFYGILNNPRRNTADPSFSRDFNCRIPFLNGGLFEAEYDWKNSFIYLDTDIFKNMFEVFDRFNFTVEEESPDDKEIAVDPEMLGKVFENLLPENLRKGKGTYYTPREIVYYMCQESLINYLDANSKPGKEKIEKCVKSLKEGDIVFSKKEAVEIDNLLKNIKVCDPACGSGAFLIGMLNEVVRLRLLLRLLYHSKLSKKSEYELKKETIQNCIYGVDIDPGAIEIAKLRLWLTLVVDYEVKDIEPLPNLDYRLMCGNSLLEEFEGVKFYSGEGEKQERTLFVDTKKRDKVTELKKRVKEYFDIHDDEEKSKKRKEINDIKDWLIRTALEKRKKEISAQKKREQNKVNMLDKKSREKYFSGWGDKFLAEAKINEVLENLHNPKKAKPFFIWKLEFIDIFEDKGGFDVVIANPPYGIPNKRQNKTIGHIMFEQQLTNIKRMDLYKPSLGGMINIYRLFIVKGIDILHDEGVMCQIFPLSFVGDISASNLRRYILDNTQIIGVEAFPERDNEKKRVFEGVKMSVCILMLEASPRNKEFYIRIHDDRYVDESKLTTILNNRLIKLIDQNYSSIPLLFPDDFNLVEKILSKSIRMGSISKCYTGEIDLTIDKKYLTNNKKDAKLIKGAQIDRYLLRDKMSQGKIKFINSGKYLKENEKGKTLHHLQKRIVMQGITGINEKNRLKMTILPAGSFCANSANYILENEDKRCDLKYLLAILNSNLLNWYFKKKSSNSNVNGYEVDDLPFPKNKDLNQKAFIEVVDEILAISQSVDYLENLSKQGKVKECERQIDKMIYKLYDLTDKEINIVENFNKN